MQRARGMIPGRFGTGEVFPCLQDRGRVLGALQDVLGVSRVSRNFPTVLTRAELPRTAPVPRPFRGIQRARGRGGGD